MEIPEKTLEAVKKVVFDIFDNGKVKDVKLRIAYDSQDEEVICVQLHVFPGDVEAYKGCLIRIPNEVSVLVLIDMESNSRFCRF